MAPVYRLALFCYVIKLSDSAIHLTLQTLGCITQTASSGAARRRVMTGSQPLSSSRTKESLDSKPPNQRPQQLFEYVKRQFESKPEVTRITLWGARYYLGATRHRQEFVAKIEQWAKSQGLKARLSSKNASTWVLVIKPIPAQAPSSGAV